jgi:hypothetical protein
MRCPALYSKVATIGVKLISIKQGVAGNNRATNQGSWVRILPGAPRIKHLGHL